MKLIICVMAAVLFMVSDQGFGILYFNDGGTHNINSLISGDVWVDYEAPGMQTAVNVLEGGGILGPGGDNYWGKLVAYNDSRINISGGYVDKLDSYNSATVNLFGGNISKLNAWDSVTVNVLPSGLVNGPCVFHNSSSMIMSGGFFAGNLIAFDTSAITITGGNFRDDSNTFLIAVQTSTVNISGGFVNMLRPKENSIIAISGGRIKQLSAYGFSETAFYGYDFMGTGSIRFDGKKVLGTGELYGKWFDGTTWTTNINIHETDATILALSPLSLNAPNGNEIITAGTIYPVSWSSKGSISNVLIEYSTNNGQDWNTVSPPNIGNTGSYGWSVPMIASQECLIRILDSANSYVSDISDNVFEIVIPKTITVSFPNGGESLISGAEQLIQWSSTGAISDILIEQSFNNGQNWFSVEPANIGNSGSYEWFVPFANSNQCLVRLSDASNPALYDTSDNVFTIMQENSSEYPTLYEILRGSAPAIIESGRDFAHSQVPDSNSIAFILLENAGYANENIFGIYSAYKPHEKLQLFSGYDGPMDTVIVRFDSAEGTAENLQTGQTAAIGDFFGFYLTTPQDGGKTFYTDASINPDSSEHGLIFNTTGFPGVLDGNPDSVIAFEDLLGLGDRDYNDMAVGITNAVPLPGSGPYCFKAIPGDLNNDCRVDLSDFAIIISHWLECNLDPQETCFSDSATP